MHAFLQDNSEITLSRQPMDTLALVSHWGRVGVTRTCYNKIVCLYCNHLPTFVCLLLSFFYSFDSIQDGFNGHLLCISFYPFILLSLSKKKDETS